MKTLIHFLFLCAFIFSSTVYGQISNLLVNGSSTHFSMESGNELSWSYSLPVGGTAKLEIWIDVNSNAVIDEGTDVLWQSFYQIDGQGGQEGPPDMDGIANGEIVFAQPIGLAPCDYIMAFENNNSTITIGGTVTPMASPVFTISGHIVVPAGNSAQYLIVNIENQNDENNRFWIALTDASGNFSLKMDADTSGNPWRLKIDNSYVLDPAVINPDRISITLDAGIKTVYPDNNFTFTAAAAEVNGTVKDEDGNFLAGKDVYINPENGTFHRNVRTDNNGAFRIGLLASELPASYVYLGSGDIEDENIVSAYRQILTIYAGNVITKDLTIYHANSTISGNVLLSGNLPNIPIQIYAIVSDTSGIVTYTDNNGNYSMPVSDKLYNYSIGPAQLPNGFISYFVTAHPGQSNVNFNFTLTDVDEDKSIVPDEFSLAQNFPNPFNPVTTIEYEISEKSNVKITLLNIIGEEVSKILNEEKESGYYQVRFNALNLPSGVYFYRMQAGNFVSVKKMILMK